MSDSSANHVLAVVTNWRRPANIPLVIEALRGQSVPVHVALVESAERGGEFALPREVLDSADTVFQVSRNLGPCARFIPPLSMAGCGFEYTFFAVDDWLPGPRCVEKFLETAVGLGQLFATIGQEGRRFDEGGIGRHRVRPAEDDYREVDVVTSSELVWTPRVAYTVRYHQRLLDALAVTGPCFEDDILLCCSVQQAISCPSYLTLDPAAEESWRYRRLPSPHALCARPDHHASRDRVIQAAIELGWRPLSR